ncbi:MAG TPA: HypC/HybG/HupF family hydrogenase formation chaperone [Bryobacteraceae bacterium]|nr:HypC/HybG/HupF family hydrogenase formation chaperone [Bryobacteraceae bacterium]
MCLAVPGKIVEVRESSGVRMATIDFGGIRREACLEYVPEAGEGDYVMVHVGFAISRVDADEAARTLELLREMDQLAEAGPEEPGGPDEVP